MGKKSLYLFTSMFFILTLVNIFWTSFGKPIFILNENQLLYFLSTLPQVIAGMFGLTLTAFVFFIDKFKETAKSDETYYEAMNSLTSKYYTGLILIAIICGFSLTTSSFGIVSFQSLNSQKWFSFLVNQTSIFFLIAMTSILSFGVMLLDPEKLDKETHKLKKKADKFYKNKIDVEHDEGNLEDFLTNYNSLESLITTFASDIDKKYFDITISSQGNVNRNLIKPQIITALRMLFKGEIITPKLMEEFNEIRKYRNGLVHGTDFMVSKSISDRIKEKHDQLQIVYDLYNSDERHEKDRNEQYWDKWYKAHKELNKD